MENKTKVWLITAKTNLHAGDENTSNYGLIDKTVQRDVLTGLPNIHGSSLKGAINEYFAHKVEKGEIKIDLKSVFGSDKTSNGGKDSDKGGCDFFDARLLFIPVQSNNRFFYQATCPAVINDFVANLKLYGINCKEFNFANIFDDLEGKDAVVFTEDNTDLGDFKAKRVTSKPEYFKRLQDLLSKDDKFEDIAVFKDDKFKELCNDFNLPIIARNKIGEQNNLWYEQMLPRETVFYTMVSERAASLDLQNKIIQIGANATVGYGYCLFNELKN